jgi:glucokinase
MYIGVEIGGSKLQLGVGLGDGVLRGLWRETVDVKAGPEGIRKQITRGIPELLEKAEIERSSVKAIGIGFGGPVDDATHAVIKSHQIEGWDNFVLADWMSEIAGMPAVLGNDSDVAGLAEALFGAGKGLNPIFYMNIGSGIGGALIVDGQIYRGCGRGAAEIGHLRVGFRRTDRAGRGVILEESASGWAIAKLAQRLARGFDSVSLPPQLRNRSPAAYRFDPDSPLYRIVLGDYTRITAVQIGEAAKQGDPLAQWVIEWVVDYVAEAICHMIALLCPRRIVMGGGVMLIGESLLGPLRERVASRVFKPFADCYDIVPAALGEEVVVHGALTLARRRS